MTPQQMVGISIRLFAVWLALKSVAYFTSIPAVLSHNPEWDLPIWSYVIGAVFIAAAFCLWFFPMAVAHKLLPRTNFQSHGAFDALDLARVGSSLIGLWLLAKALPTLAWYLFRSYLMVQTESSFSALDANAKLELAVTFFEVILALVLIVKAQVFARIVFPQATARQIPEQ